MFALASYTPRLIVPVIARPVTIEGFGHYLASYWGGVIINTKNNKASQGTSTAQYYRRVDLRANGKRSCQYVHRLVCSVWKPNEEDKSDVNHIDRIRSSNSAPNLEWLTHAENMAYINCEPLVEVYDSAPF